MRSAPHRVAQGWARSDEGATTRDELGRCGVLGPQNSVLFKPVGGAAFNANWGRGYCFQEILEDLRKSGHQFKAVALIYAGNDLGRIDNQCLAGLISDLSNWATNHQVVVRLVDVVGRTYLPNS